MSIRDEIREENKKNFVEAMQEKAQEIQMNAKGQFDPEAMQKMQELQAEFQKTAQSLDSLCTKPVAPVVVPAEEIVNNNETAANDSVAIDNQEQSANN